MQFEAGLPDALARELRLRSALGGVLAEDDDPGAPAETWRVVSRREPSAQEWHDLAFAWDVVRHVKSNGIVIVKGGTTRGICAGQTNRVSAVQIAALRAGDAAHGAACASDGFFPFADGLGGCRRGRLHGDHRAGRFHPRRRSHCRRRPARNLARVLDLPLFRTLT